MKRKGLLAVYTSVTMLHVGRAFQPLRYSIIRNGVRSSAQNNISCIRSNRRKGVYRCSTMMMNESGSSSEREAMLFAMPLNELKALAAENQLTGKQRRTIVAQLMELGTAKEEVTVEPITMQIAQPELASTQPPPKKAPKKGKTMEERLLTPEYSENKDWEDDDFGADLGIEWVTGTIPGLMSGKGGLDSDIETSNLNFGGAEDDVILVPQPKEKKPSKKSKRKAATEETQLNEPGILTPAYSDMNDWEDEDFGKDLGIEWVSGTIPGLMSGVDNTAYDIDIDSEEEEEDELIDGWLSGNLGAGAKKTDPQIEAALAFDGTQKRGMSTKAGAGKTKPKPAMDMQDRLKAAVQNRIPAKSLGDSVDAASYGFDSSDDKIKKQSYSVDSKAGCCPGCGVKFQTEDDAVPGFLPIDKLRQLLAYREEEKIRRQEESGHFDIDRMTSQIGSVVDFDEEEARQQQDDEMKATVCQRCHRLKYQGQVDDELRPGISTHELLTPKRFEELLGTLKNTRCLIVYLVDLFDFHGSFLYNLPKIIGENPIIIAANKVDLLPKDMSRDRVKTWVRDECRYRGLPFIESRDIHLVSCKSGFGVAVLMRKARETAIEMNVNMYVIGSANVGKSTFINHLLQDKTIVKKGKASQKNKLLSQGLTVSMVPGTTLDFLKIDLGDVSLYDTPGLILPHQITSRLNPEELKAVIPQKQVEHVTLRLQEGKCVLIGGLVKVELLEGRPFLFTFFISNNVKLHMTDVTRAEDFIDKHIGSDLLFPPYSKERLEELGPMVTSEFIVSGSGWKQSVEDIVLSGLGWVSVTGAGECRVKVTAPQDMLVMTRPAMMPFEAWDTTSTFTGGRTVKKGKKVQGRRA